MTGPLDDLVYLDSLLTKAREREDLLADIPEQLNKLNEMLHEAQHGLEQANENQKQATKQRRSQEVELEAAEQKISRYKTQLMDVKSNDEYAALNKELAHEQETVAKLEELILQDMESAEQVVGSKKAAEQVLAEAQSEVEGEQKRLAARKQELEVELADFTERADKLRATLPDDLRQLVTRLAKGRRSSVLSAIVDYNCTGCRMRVRPQVVAELTAGDRIIQCEYCARILHVASLGQT
jgi:predicted  nucleic acid-binding Zn-ribbon protein